MQSFALFVIYIIKPLNINLMKRILKLPVAAAVLAFVFASCSSTDLSKYPYLSNISDSGCLGNDDFDYPAVRSETDNPDIPKHIFEMTWEGNEAKCKYYLPYYTCGLQPNINVIYNDGVMTIIEFPTGMVIDCTCPQEVYFDIKDFPENDFILKIYRGKTKVNDIGEIEGTGEYDEAHPLFDGLVEIKKGSFSTPN